MLRAAAVWALLTGFVLASLELQANWGDWQWWPWWLVDFVAAALLIVGAIKTLRCDQDGRIWLAAGWSFTLGMAWMSLAGNMEVGPDSGSNTRLGGFYVIAVAALVASSLIGMLLTLFARR